VEVNDPTIRVSELVLPVDEGLDIWRPCPDIVDRWCTRLRQTCPSESSHKDGNRVFQVGFSDLSAASLAMLTNEPAEDLLEEQQVSESDKMQYT